MNTNQVMVKMVLDSWNTLVKSCTNQLASITDEQLQKEIVPGKNRGIYLLGHLVAVHDNMISLLGLGDKLYPEIQDAFIKFPDRSITAIPSVQELRIYWREQNEALTLKLNSLQADEWFQQHTAVSDEDFLKEPHRNKLNILITRACHLSYHTGQLMLLK